MASTRLITAIVAGTMGLSGFLLFQVQPVMAKYVACKIFEDRQNLTVAMAKSCYLSELF